MESHIIGVTDVRGVVFYIPVVAGCAVAGGVGEFAAIGERKGTTIEFYVLYVVILFALHPQKLGTTGPKVMEITPFSHDNKAKP